MRTHQEPVQLSDDRGVAALEFAIIAPVLLLMIWGVYDLGRALLAWEETYHAAEAIAQAAEKLSVTGRVNNITGFPIVALTSDSMQDAMTTVYAEMPFLGLGDNTGTFNGQFSVTLSGVFYSPACSATNGGPPCGPQLANVAWSAYLAKGGAQLLAPPMVPPTAVQRACLLPLGGQKGAFPNNSTQLTVLLDANEAGAGGTSVILIPQVVADVQYVFKPSFPLITKTFTFWASATFPAPLGGDTQQIQYDLTNSVNNKDAVIDCGVSTI
jgi:hypothetical protein